jgi:hypothetical protein
MQMVVQQEEIGVYRRRHLLWRTGLPTGFAAERIRVGVNVEISCLALAASLKRPWVNGSSAPSFGRGVSASSVSLPLSLEGERDGAVLLAVVPEASVELLALIRSAMNGSGEMRMDAAAVIASSNMLDATAIPSDSTRADNQPEKVELLQNFA